MTRNHRSSPFVVGRPRYHARGAIEAFVRHPQGYSVTYARTLMMGTRNLEATLAVDKLFSIYRILSAEGSPLAQKPDYTKADIDTFREATIALIRYDGSLKYLFEIPGTQEFSTGTSWYINFGTTARRAMENHSYGDMPKRSPDISDDERSLFIRGKLADVVIKTARPTSSVETDMGVIFAVELELLETLLGWFQIVLSLNESPAPKAFEFFKILSPHRNVKYVCTLAELFLCLTPWHHTEVQSVLSTGSNSNATTHGTYKYEEKGLKRLEELCDVFAMFPLQSSPGSSFILAKMARQETFESGKHFGTYTPLDRSRWAREDYLLCLKHASERELLITQNGFIGLTNGHVKAGDLIVLVTDLDSPAIIRKVADETFYTFVGVTEIECMMPQYSRWWNLNINRSDIETMWDNKELADDKLTIFELV